MATDHPPTTQERVNGTRTRKDGTKMKMVALEMPLDLYTELARGAVVNERSVSKQIIFYLRAALAKAHQE